MTFDEVLEQVRELLQRKGRVAYRTLKRRFVVDDEFIEDLKAELIDADRMARDEDGRVLVWIGRNVEGEKEPDAAERRQLTVLFCDLVGSIALSSQLDPEELRDVVRVYHETSAGIISRHGGHAAQHLGDGVLVYFGYPAAHEDDAQRAVRAGLEILTEIPSLNAQLQPTIRARLPHPIQVRIGIHTGLVVIGEVGSSDKREMLALGETPNLAARLQAAAESNTLVISAGTHRLTQGLFACRDLGPQALKGMTTPVSVYQVLRESGAQNRFDAAVQAGLTPLVGREDELAFLRRCWDQAKAGEGRIVLLSGEPGIGKSRLVQEFKNQLAHDGMTRIEFRCSPYHQHSAFHPIIEHLQSCLRFTPDDSPVIKLEKLQHWLHHYRFPQEDTVPLLAILLSLPHPEGVRSLTVSPQKQKEKTQAAVVAWLIEEAERQPVCHTWEDVHWADPSTLEVLDLVVRCIPTTSLYVLLTFRPEFTPPWGDGSHLSRLTLGRLGRRQVEAMIGRITDGKVLPAEVVQQIVTKTDGVPLFVEELTKMVVESGLLREQDDRYELTGPLPPLAIPDTLQASLMARLDRLAVVKAVAQLGSTIGREFSYGLIRAMSSLDEATLQQGLQQLVEAELIYQRGARPKASYVFKHALVQDAAYQSLLKSRRQQYHQQITRVLEERFPETKDAQPELLAHHYTEAGLIPQALPYWQAAGRRAVRHSAHVEASSHFTRGLELLTTLPATPERVRQELELQISLGTQLIVTKGYAALDVERCYARARELCGQIGETSQLFPVGLGLCIYYVTRARYSMAQELAEQLVYLAQRQQDDTFLVIAHWAAALPILYQGEIVTAGAHQREAISHYRPQQHRYLNLLYGQDPKVAVLAHGTWTLWLLGYPDQALTRGEEALTYARELSYPFGVSMALNFLALIHQIRRDSQAARAWSEEAIRFADAQGFPFFLTLATIIRGGALAEQESDQEGIGLIRQGLVAHRTRGAELGSTYCLALLADRYSKRGQVAEGLAALVEAFALVNDNEERWWEAELYRLKGELLLAQGQTSSTARRDAEQCFHQAIAIARRQSAKSLELRATVNLSRLWRQQGKTTEARDRLVAIYGWFTEGFDTKDLQEAERLITELS